MELTEQQRAACAALEDSWYWQVQERGKWRYRWHNEVMVRYYECAPLEADVFPAMIEYLQGQTGITAIQLHGKRIDLGGEWKAVRAWYETRDGDTSETNKLKRVRICQALVKNAEEAGGDGPHVVEDGCMYKVSHTFHWNVDALPSLPESSSGVNYQILAVTRDDETGLWNCVVEKRERVEQEIAQYTTEETEFEKKKEEQHLGVKQGDVEKTGEAASVTDGKMVTRKLKKNEDCTTDVINETTEEKAVAEAVTETEMNLRGTVTTTVNRSMEKKADESKLGIGETVRNEKTPGGRWTQTIKKVVAAAAGKIREVCRKTAFRHTHVETVNQKADPGFTHVAEAGEGVMHEIEVQRSEREGTYDITETTHEDVEVEGAVTETRKYLDGTVTRTVNRNQATKASEAKLGVGDSVRNEKTESGLWDQTIEKSSPEATGRTAETCEETALVHAHSTTEGVGSEKPEGEAPTAGQGETTTRRIAKTERGAWNVTEEKRTAKERTIELEGGSNGRKVVTLVMRNAAEMETGAGGDNVEVEASGSINEFGLVDGTKRTVTYEAKKKTASGGTVHRTVEVESAINSKDTPGEQGPKNVEVEVSVSPNEHGTASWTKRTVTYSEARKMAKGGAEYRTVEVESAINSEDVPEDEETETNVETEVSVSPNEHGTASWTKRTTKYKETSCEKTSGGPLVEVERKVVANAEDEPEDEYEEDKEGEITELSAAENQHGSYDYTRVKRKCHDKEKLVTWETDDGTNLDTHFVYVFRNKKIEEMPDVDDVKAAGVEFGESGRPASASMSVSINEFGRVDGVISGIAKREAGGKGTSSDDQGEMTGKKETVVRIWQRNGVPTKYRFELTYDSFWGGSGAWLEKKRAEVANASGTDCRGYPELGCKSGYYGSVMRVYRSCKLVETGAVTQGSTF